MNHFGYSIGNAVTLYLQLNNNRILCNSAGLRSYKGIVFRMSTTHHVDLQYIPWIYAKSEI